MKTNLRTLLCLLLAAMVLTAAAWAAEAGEWKTMGDVFAYDSDNYASSDQCYVYVFEADGVFYRATAELPPDVSETLWSLDFFDENYEAMVRDAVAPLEITELENLSERIPPQEELDALAGRDAQELLDEGWTIWSWNLDDMELGMYHGPFAFQVLCEGTVDDPDDFDGTRADGLTVTSVTYDGIGDAAGEKVDEYFEAAFGEDEWISWDGGIDYLALVNKQNPLPEGWEDALETVTVTNSVGDEVEVEAEAYAAYELLKADLEANNAIYLELDSARRSVAAQQDIMDRFIEKYGADYAAKTVAQPGYSEHHTGLALDLYFRIQNDNGEFTDVYYNEDMEKPEYEEIWDEIHAKLADYGFILRYLEGEEHITGYRYEPWHIRYVGDPDIAREIMSEPGLTLEEYLAGQSAPEVAIDLGESELYTEEERYDAVLAIKCQFAAWAGCELHSVRYAGDEACSEEDLAWLNSLEEGAEFTQGAEFLMDFHSPVEDGPFAWNVDEEYTDYQWWLARTEDGGWEIVSWGY